MAHIRNQIGERNEYSFVLIGSSGSQYFGLMLSLLPEFADDPAAADTSRIMHLVSLHRQGIFRCATKYHICSMWIVLALVSCQMAQDCD